MSRYTPTNANDDAFASTAFDRDSAFGECGLTKREYFAATALQGLMAHQPLLTPEFATARAVQAADALIAALNAEVQK